MSKGKSHNGTGALGKGCYFALLCCFLFCLLRLSIFYFFRKGNHITSSGINLLTIILSVLNLLIVILSSNDGPLDWQVFAQVCYLLAKL